MVSSNIVFLIVWVFFFFREIERRLLLKFSKVYLYLCLCKNERKMEERKKALDVIHSNLDSSIQLTEVIESIKFH